MTNSNSAATSSLDNLKPLLDERAELAMAKKRIEDRIKTLDGEIRPMLEGRGEIVYNGYTHSVTKVPGRKSVDYKAMAEDHNIDLDDYAKVGAPSTRYNLKAVNEL